MNQFYDDTTKTLRYVGQSKQELLAIPDIESVRHIVIDGKIEIIPGDLFRDKSFYDVETIEFAEDGDLKIIEREAFQKFGKLKAIRFPDSLKTIGVHAFSRCHLLTSIELPVNGDLEEIQRWAFCNCARYIKDETEFISIHIPKSVKKIGRGAFTIRPLKRIDFAPDCQLETIDETTFKNCENLESILIPACVKKIKKRAFSHCKSLKTIKFTDDSKLEEIHEESFCNTGLESIEIPMLVTQIRLRAFSNCESLASITFAENSKLVYLPLEAFDGRMKPIPPPSCPFFDEKEFKYKGKSYDLTKNPFEFDEQALTIFRRFPVFGNIQHATFNQSIQEIPDDSFKEVCSLISIEIPSSVQIIGKNAFRECKSLATVRFASDHDCNLEEIDDFAFYSCTNLVSIDFPSSLKIIGTSVFEFCSSLATARFADDSNLKDVEHKAFRSCKDLWNMRIPKAAAIREDNSVKDCALKESQYRSRYNALPVHKLLYSSIVPDNGDDIVQILKELKILGKKKDFELVDDLSGMTPLHLYASLPAGSINVEVLKCLLNMGPDTWLERQDKRGRLPIHYACMVGESNLSIIELLSSKLDVFKRDNDGYMPLMLGIRFNNLNSDAKTLLYKCQPISPLMGSGVKETKRLKNLKEEYIDWITKAGSIKKDSFSPHLQNGWVTFLIKCLDDDDDSDAKKMAELNRVDVDSLRLLATAKDKLGREAIKVAPPTIKKALQKILLFLGRYDLVEGEPIHQSATCVVIRAKDAKMEDNYKKIFKKYKKDSFLDQENFGKALQFLMIISDELDKQDNPLLKQYFEFTDATKKGKISENEFIGFCMKEGGSEVALKLMKNKDEYERELSTRESLMIANCIVPVLTSHDSEHDSEDEVNIKESLTRHIKKYLPKDENENPEEYCHVLVMPFGDRDLDTIFRSEMRRDPIKVRDYAKQIAQLLRKLHDCGLVHGDLKMHNVVRIKSRLRLIDLDASASVHHRIGSKFSSGVVPPEMIYCLTDDNEEEQILKYYEDADDEHKKKRAPKNVGDEHNKRGYIVRSFSVKREDSLPYDICIAKKSMDVWAFGVMLYNMCTLKSLFPVNLDDDITEGEDLKKLHEWRTFCMRVNDHNAKRLLEQILQRTPEDRPTMEEILGDAFFRMNEGIAKVQEDIQKILDMQMSTNRMVKSLLDGRNYPRYLIPLPTSRTNPLKPDTWFKNEVKVYFVCPILMEIPVGLDGELLGYKLEKPKEWVRKYGPALLLAWKIARVAAKTGGVNLPSLKGLEEMIIKKDTSGFLENLQAAVLFELKATKRTPTWSDFLEKECINGFEKLVNGEQSIPASYSEQALKSYDAILKELRDPQFKKSGLVLATCFKDGTTEFVHPDIVSVFEEHGKKCFNMSPEKINKKKKAAIERRIQRWKDDCDNRKDREEETSAFRRREFAYDGSLLKLGQNFPARWCERYFVVLKNGKVKYYDEESHVDDLAKPGILLDVKLWRRADSADKKEAHIVLEMEKAKDQKMQLRLSSGDNASDIDKWIKEGNESLASSGP